MKLIESTGKFWETVYSQNIGKMIGICYRYTANRQLSEDLAHDAFLKAIDKSASFEGKGCFEAWLRRIVVNHVLQYIRDQKRRKYTDDWLQYESYVLQTEDNNLNNPSEQVEFSEKELLDAINDLPEHHRLVFNLYVIDNFTHVQIGEALGISSGTSKSHLARARKKVRELLTQKTNQKPDRKRGLLLFFFPYRLRRIDQVYQEQFNNFELPPDKILSPDFGEAPAVPVMKSLSGTSWNYIMAAASIGLILTAGSIVFYLNQRQNSIDTTGTELAQSTIYNGDKHAGLVQKSGEEVKERGKTADRENNSRVADSNTATISRKSIILKTIKTKSMKSVDSLGIMFLMSSSIIFDTAAQTSNKEAIQVNTETQIPAMKIQTSEPVKMISFVADHDVKKSKSEEGTFYASSLFWSGKDNELYLKGKIRVDFDIHDFIADGSCSFLGPVYLLIVDDTPATHDSAIKLSRQQYRLNRLSNKEATEKYGEKGRQGAVEISVVE